MFLLSEILNIISCLYLFPLLRLQLIILFEVIYNSFNNIFMIKRNKFKKCESTKTVLITGGTRGIGEAIIHKLVALNYKIIIISRDIEKMTHLQNLYGKDKISFYAVDLSEIKQVKVVAGRLKHVQIDILINNAGVFRRKFTTKHNIEYQFLINHISHYILSKKIKAGKVVNVSSSVIYSLSEVRKERFNIFMEHYAQSKLANLLHSLYMKNKGIKSCAVHPGIVCTELFDSTYYGLFVRFLHRIAWFIFTDVNDAADNVIYAALSEDVFEDKENVDFYMYMHKARSPHYVNMKNAKKLMDLTVNISSQFE